MNSLVIIYFSVHSSDVIHGQNFRFNGMKLWVDRNFVVLDFSWSKAKREIMKRQEAQIELIKMTQESLSVIENVHDQLMCLLILP